MLRGLLVPLVAASLVIAGWCCNARADLNGDVAPTNACGDSAAVSWEPDQPREGSLFRVRVSRAPSGATISGEVAGEALHFGAVSGQPVEAIAAVPIDSSASLGVRILCTVGVRTDTMLASLAPSRGAYPVEHLTVAPTFGKAPDSALAARMRRESERATAVAIQSHETPRLWTKPFIHPRDSRITSGF